MSKSQEPRAIPRWWDLPLQLSNHLFTGSWLGSVHTDFISYQVNSQLVLVPAGDSSGWCLRRSSCCGVVCGWPSLRSQINEPNHDKSLLLKGYLLKFAEELFNSIELNTIKWLRSYCNHFISFWIDLMDADTRCQMTSKFPSCSPIVEAWMCLQPGFAMACHTCPTPQPKRQSLVQRKDSGIPCSATSQPISGFWRSLWQAMARCNSAYVKMKWYNIINILDILGILINNN